MRFFWIGFFVWLCTAVSHAHDVGLSTAEIAVKPAEIEVVVSFAPADAAVLGLGSESLPLPRATEMITLRSTDAVRSPRSAHVVLSEDNVTMHVLYPGNESGGPFSVEMRMMDELSPGHRMFVTVSGHEREVLMQRLLGRDERIVDVLPVGTQGKAGRTGAGHGPGSAESGNAHGFFLLGIEHILTGYDHLLFLLGLLVVCVRGRSILAIVTCFTVAHSITLALAALEIVELSPRWVEPLIAATIVYVGAENLIARGTEPSKRWMLTFSFGLIHGFGFAGVLREAGLGSTGAGVGWPLLKFNLGVEAGQLAVAAVGLPLLWWLRKKPWFVLRGVPVLSGAIVCAGLYWLIERLMGL